MSSVAGPSPLVDFIAGTAGGVGSLLAGHPFDTVKTRLQTQSSAAQASYAAPAFPQEGAHDGSARRTYRSATHAFRVIVQDEKLFGLYKGVTSPMLGVAVMNASVFGVYGLAIRCLQASALFGHRDDAEGYPAEPSLAQVFLAGAASGVISALITSPIELVKIREQLDFTPKASSSSHALRPSSTMSVVQAIWSEGGLRAIYRGLGATCIRDVGYVSDRMDDLYQLSRLRTDSQNCAFQGPYFFTYEYLNRWILTTHDRPLHGSALEGLSNVELALSGAIAGIVGWMSTFWADTVKTRIQASKLPLQARAGDAGVASADRMRLCGGEQHSEGSVAHDRSRGFMAQARCVHQEGGLRGFWKGAGPTILRAIPVNATLFIVYEATKDALISWGM
ncbi:Mitochondrial carrier protein [Ceraceosorus bombacis]|uniref:Mitochondrial carrier protein n=1 Tax=Ceraceosorus bombacis TaxID=401625 RepID=A0A0P1BTS5_9BASI|nr:Mitochondrial carrier protein [Ceraceosorus bombacis]